MIRCIANVGPGEYLPGTFEQFQEFLESLKAYQLDVETNVANSVIDQRLRTVQFGEFNAYKEDKTQWVIEWDILNKAQQGYVLYMLADGSVVKLWCRTGKYSGYYAK
jgi:putative component of toxin-antitoxin plasmid stabilization module